MGIQQEDLAALIHQALFSTNRVANLVRFDIVEVANTVSRYLLEKRHKEKLLEILSGEATQPEHKFVLWLFGYTEDDFYEIKFSTALEAYKEMRRRISKDLGTNRYKAMNIYDLSCAGTARVVVVRWRRDKEDECYISDEMVELIGAENIC